MNVTMKNGVIKARTFCKFFRFIDDLNSISGGKELETNCNYIYPEELELGKENNDKR